MQHPLLETSVHLLTNAERSNVGRRSNLICGIFFHSGRMESQQNISEAKHQNALAIWKYVVPLTICPNAWQRRGTKILPIRQQHPHTPLSLWSCSYCSIRFHWIQFVVKYAWWNGVWCCSRVDVSRWRHIGSAQLYFVAERHWISGYTWGPWKMLSKYSALLWRTANSDFHHTPWATASAPNATFTCLSNDPTCPLFHCSLTSITTFKALINTKPPYKTNAIIIGTRQ